MAVVMRGRWSADGSLVGLQASANSSKKGGTAW
jgi:hypothetical protein